MKGMELDRFEKDQGVGMRSTMGVGMRRTIIIFPIEIGSSAHQLDQISSSAHQPISNDWCHDGGIGHEHEHGRHGPLHETDEEGDGQEDV